jgi:hypothetical protein
MDMWSVTWGDTTQAVYAESEQEAWNEFARGNSLAQSHPHLYERTIAPYEAMQEFDDPGVVN